MLVTAHLSVWSLCKCLTKFDVVPVVFFNDSFLTTKLALSRSSISLESEIIITKHNRSRNISIFVVSTTTVGGRYFSKTTGRNSDQDAVHASYRTAKISNIQNVR